MTERSALERRVAHPRATWLDPQTGLIVPQKALLEALSAKRVVLLGESHDIAEIHRWQLHVAVALHASRPRLAMGFEMFPRRVQPELDAWVDGTMDTATFIERVEWSKVWGFEFAIYAPLFHFCRQHKVPMLALNCHRPLVTRVGQFGWATIPIDERDGVTPAASATDGYRAYLAKLMGGMRSQGTDGTAPDISDRFIRAQQTWDRAFACGIADHLADAGDDALVVGIIGRGHLEYGHGTPYQLADLGIDDVAVLLPTDQHEHDRDDIAGIAQAIFRLDTPDPRQPRLPRPQAGAEASA